MTIALTQLEQHYLVWADSQEKQKEVKTELDGIAVDLIFLRGTYVFPERFCPTPMAIPNSMNVCSNSQKVQEAFNRLFPNKDPITGSNRLRSDSEKIFDLLFFENRQATLDKIQADEKKNESMKKTRFCELL